MRLSLYLLVEATFLRRETDPAAVFKSSFTSSANSRALLSIFPAAVFARARASIALSRILWRISCPEAGAINKPTVAPTTLPTSAAAITFPVLLLL
jgi:hypothetical protein